MSSKNFIVKNGISIGENEIVSANGDMFLHGSLKVGGHTLINTSGDLTVPGNLVIGTTTVQSNVNDHANSAFDKANTADQRAVTSGVYANAAYEQANTATTNAATADQRAVTSGNYANSAYIHANTKYSSSGGTISGDVNITGNLNITGNTVTHSANDFIVNDPLILLANNNPGNLLDTGFIAHYIEGGTTKHSGLVRDSSANTYYLFDGYVPHIQETNILDVNEATLRITTLRANLVSDSVIVRGHDVVNHANSAFAAANTKSPLAGSSSVTTTGTITSGTWSASFGAVSGANLTSLTAGNLSGTIPSGVLGNSVHFVGTTSIALNRGSASQTLTGVSIDGNAATATALQTARTIGGVSFNGTANINLPGVNTAGNQNTSGTAASISGFNNPTTSATGNTIAYRDGSGHLSMVYGFSSYLNMSHSVSGATTDTVFYSSYDDYIRKNNATGFRASLNVPTRTGGDASGNWGISITGRGYPRRWDGGDINFIWSGQGGQPTWLWGGTDGTNMYVYNPSNFSVNYASSSGNANSISNAVGGSYTWTATQYFTGNGNTGPSAGIGAQVYSTGGNGATMAFHRAGHYAVNMGLDNDNVIRIGGWSASANRWELDMSGNNWVASSFRAPIFYDSNDTAYYCDPNSRSRFVALKLNTGNWITDSLDFNRIHFTQGDGTMIRGYTGSWYIQMGSTSTTTTIVEGAGNFYTTGAVTAYWSDKRLKKNIKKIDDWREILNKSNGYRFEWNDIGLKILGDSAEQEMGVKVGVLAQETKEALPQAAVVQLMQYEKKENGVLIPKEGINYDPEDPYLTVHMEKYIPVLIEACKGLMEENTEIKQLMMQMQDEINLLKGN